MKVGIFNYTKRDLPTIERVLKELGFDVDIYDYKENHYEIMQKSNIKHWFFTGSPMDITKDRAPQLDTRILRMGGKRVFLICYAMESILGQLGCKLIKRERNRKRTFLLNILYNNYLTKGLCSPIKAWRNHETYIPVSSLRPCVKLQMQYEGEVMTCLYKNAVMTQWHPEHGKDGKEMIMNWLNR
jgi:GMP synthase-like glutamine amidotransferase